MYVVIGTEKKKKKEEMIERTTTRTKNEIEEIYRVSERERQVRKQNCTQCRFLKAQIFHAGA